MNTFFLIILIICLAVQIPVWILYIISRIFSSKETKKEIKDTVDKEMKRMYPDWPNVKRPKDNHINNQIICGGNPFIPGMF